MTDSKTPEVLEARVRQLEAALEDRDRKIERLLTDERRYQTLLDSSPVGIWLAGPDGSGGLINAKLAEITGMSVESAQGSGWARTLHPEDRDRVWQQWSRFVEGQAPYESTYRFRHESGEVRWVMGQAARVVGTDGEPIGYLGTLTDITELKRIEAEKRELEAQVQHDQKLKAIGTLAGGIAHDFNNLLMAIQGNALAVQADVDPTDEQRVALDDIVELVKAGARLTSLLLGYARKGRYRSEVIDLNRLVREVADTLGRTKKEVVLAHDLAADLEAVEADRGQIERVLLNLFVNAAESMPRGGRIELRTRNVPAEAVEGEPAQKPGRGFVRLEVADTGVGMDEETRRRAFEPFFTTKAPGKGHGLGLAAVQGIVTNHGGRIEIESKEGVGTTTTVLLPASDDTPRAVAKVVTRRSKPVARTALVIDDEELVLRAIARLLGRLGLTVLQANGGERGIELLREHKPDVDLVVLDMTMPGMSGAEAFGQLKEVDPDVKILLASGYSLEGKAQEVMDRGCDGFIKKPFGLEEVSRKIDELFGPT